MNFPDDFKLIYGDVSTIKGSRNDLFYLADQLVAGATRNALSSINAVVRKIFFMKIIFDFEIIAVKGWI